MARHLFSSLEPLESRIAPASLIVYHPLIDVVPSLGATGTVINLAQSIDSDPAAGYRSHVTITTNYDTDPNTPGLQAGKIVLELFDDKAPLTVKNFLNYVEHQSGYGGYLNTYFHRLVSGFVLQGGGYSAATPAQHIAVGPAVHNEYVSATADPERSNVAGTIAMAESGTDQNSATSEFFINLGNNDGTGAYSNLNTLNGGFTVFGKVVQGMEVVNAIAALPTTDSGGSNSSSTAAVYQSAPFQNGYNPDPDHNTSTAAPVPKVSQLIDITGISVVAPHPSAIAGVTYTLKSITDGANGGQTADFVTGKITGSNLALRYVPGGSGVATVVVGVHKTSDGASIANDVTETFHVKMLPNLVGTATGDTLHTYISAGDTGTETLKLTNTGGGTATGAVTVKYYLSHVDGLSGSDPQGTIVDPTKDLLLGTSDFTNLNLASGASTVITKNVAIPSMAELQTAGLATGTYRILEQISAPAGLQADNYTDDNLVIGGGHYLVVDAKGAEVGVAGLTDTFSSIIVPGDTATAKITLRNFAQSEAHENVTVNFYLISSTLLTRTALNSLGSETRAIDLSADQSTSLTFSLKVPTALDLPEGTYQVVGELTAFTSTAAGGGAVTDLYRLDDIGVGASAHLLSNSFGALNAGTVKRSNVSLTYTDPDHANQLVTLKLTGAGYGLVSHDANGGIVVDVDGTNLASKLTATVTSTAAGIEAVHTLVQDLTVGASTGAAIGSMDLGLVDFGHSVTAAGGVKTLTLGQTSTVTDGSHTIAIGTSAAAVAAKIRPVVKLLGTVTDTSLNSALPLGSVTSPNWLEANDTTHTLRAPAIDSLVVPGTFEPDVKIIPSVNSAAQVLKNFTVGILHGSTVQVEGNVGTVTLASMKASNFLVDINQVPTDSLDFDAMHSIAKLTVTGAQGLSGSNIAAPSLGMVSIKSVAATTTGTPYGLITEKIASYTEDGQTLKNLTLASNGGMAVADQHGDYQVTLRS